MLILTRQVGQSLKIGDDVTVTVLASHAVSQVKFGINAPRSVAVHRSEIHDRIQSKLDQDDGSVAKDLPCQLQIFDGQCDQIQRGEHLINQLFLKKEYDNSVVNEFCFDDAGDGKIKIMVDLGLDNDSEYWDKEFTKKLPKGFEDFFHESNNNGFFYAQFV